MVWDGWDEKERAMDVIKCNVEVNVKWRETIGYL